MQVYPGGGIVWQDAMSFSEGWRMVLGYTTEAMSGCPTTTFSSMPHSLVPRRIQKYPPPRRLEAPPRAPPLPPLWPPPTPKELRTTQSAAPGGVAPQPTGATACPPVEG